MPAQVLRRVVRRETHSPRSGATVMVLVLLVAAAVYVGTEIILWALGRAPLLSAPGAALDGLAELPRSQPQVAVIAGAAVVAVIGLLLIWLAVSPGRLARHELAVTDHAVVADNAVIAAAVAQSLRQEVDLAGDGLVVGISHRGADIMVRPEPGQVLDTGAIRAVAQARLEADRVVPELGVHVRVRRRGDAGGRP